MQSSSRRAFLTGQRPPRDPWAAFCHRLGRLVTGTVRMLDAVEGHGRARLVVQQLADLHHARALCAAEGVVMALDGLPTAHPACQEPVLYVLPGRDIARCERLEPGGTRWFVQPGCLVGELEALGFTALAGVPAHLTVAAWLSDPVSMGRLPPGRLQGCGLVYASVLLANGTSAGLGPFGERNTKPLQGMALQRLVSSLFQLAGSPEGQLCRQQPVWPARYRLDALTPAASTATGEQEGVNLARLLLGQAGELGWLEWVVLDTSLMDAAVLDTSMTAGIENGQVVEGTHLAVAPEPDVQAAARQLDRRVKALFDPAGVLSPREYPAASV